MRDPDLVERAQRAAMALERAWDRFRTVHGLGAEPLAPVSSYVGYSLEEPWGEPRVVFGVAAEEAEKLAALLNGHDCGSRAAPGKPAVANGRLAGLTAAAEIARAVAGARLQVPAQPQAGPRERLTNARPPAAPGRPDDSRRADGPPRTDDPTEPESLPRSAGQPESPPEPSAQALPESSARPGLLPPPATVIPEVREPSPADAAPPLSPAGVAPPPSPAGVAPPVQPLPPVPPLSRAAAAPQVPPLSRAGATASAGPASPVLPASPATETQPAAANASLPAAAGLPGEAGEERPPDRAAAQANGSETGLTAFRPGVASLPDGAAEPGPFIDERSAADGEPAQRPRPHRHAMQRPARQKRGSIPAESDSQQPARQGTGRRGGGQRHASNAGADGLAAMAGDLAGWASGELPGQAARQTAPWTPTYRDPDDADPAGGNSRIDKVI